MEINIKYNLVRETLKYINNLSKNDKKIWIKKNVQILKYLSFNSKITEDVIKFYNLDIIKEINFEQNPNFNINWIKKYKKRQWDFKLLSLNPNFTINWIEEYPNKKWDYKNLSINPNFSFDCIKKFPNKDWDYKKLSLNSKLSYEIIKKYPDKDWNYEYLVINKYIPFEFIEKYPNKNYGNKVIYYQLDNKINNNTIKDYVDNRPKNIEDSIFFWNLSQNKNFNLEWIHLYPNKEWNLFKLQLSPNFSIDWIKKYPYYKWGFNFLHKNSKFNFKWVQEFPEKDWNFHELQNMPNFKFELVKEFPDHNWDFYNIPNKLIDINFVKKYPDKNWDTLNIIKHPKFTKDILNKTTNILFKINYDIYFNKYFNSKLYQKHKEIEWNYDKIEETRNFNIYHVLDNYTYKWSYIYNKNNYKKSYNKEDTKNEKTKFSILNFDKDFDIEWLKKYPDKKWNKCIICLHPNFKIKWLTILEKKYKPHLFKILSKNLNFSINWIKKYFYADWDYNYIFKHHINKDNIREFIKIFNNTKNLDSKFKLFLQSKFFLQSNLITIDIINEFNNMPLNYEVLYKN
tara:strand:- start:84 stop:1790 length:1707 start_codon:yes stop_codon:yes gene_type:complete